ncbi:MAG TPA: NAD(P)-dependent oxidoreductase [Puia sp.]|jgi:nucleoside-diphosphate-sugar epimerase|nr:NAD(P)-dependent oxidoreductase [Puia sp.]
MNKILVTGATGFIGRYVVEQLLARGCRVTATSSREDKARQFSWFDQVSYVPFDLADLDPEKDYFRVFGEPDVMIHLAWEGLPHYRSGFHLEINFPRHAAFLGNLVRHGLGDLTVAGTCLEYGMQEGCLREDMPSFPGNPYAKAKDDLRKFLLELQLEHSFTLKWVRLFYLYGKGQNPGSLVPQLERALQNGDKVFNMSGGEQVRDFLPVEEVADYLIKVALQPEITGIINVCSGKPVSIKQFIENYLSSVQGDIALNLGYYPYPDYEPMRFWGDARKLNLII